jgi:hypothetical protein
VVGNILSSNSTSNTTGSLQVIGGVGVTGNVWASQLRQTSSEVAIGQIAGLNQGLYAVAVGYGAGGVGQGTGALSFGISSGYNLQGDYGIAIGTAAGSESQEYGAIAIGLYAGNNYQGANAIAIGTNAGVGSQAPNSIMLNASGEQLSGGLSGLYINPVRNDDTSTSQAIYYNTDTKELTYAAGGSGGVTLGQVTAVAMGFALP